jgi:enamine deaminase RidA (YjgF/YER057c/UK114 family)
MTVSPRVRALCNTVRFSDRNDWLLTGIKTDPTSIADAPNPTYNARIDLSNRWMAIMKRGLTLLLPSCLFGVILMVPTAAQTPPGTAPNIRFINPPTMPKPPGYTQVVEANTPGRIVYIAGQLGYDAAGKQGADFHTQATLVFENLKAAVESVGGRMENIVKLNTYLTDIRTQLPIVRDIRDKYVNTAAPPASTTLEISKLAREGALIEVEAVAVLPAR